MIQFPHPDGLPVPCFLLAEGETLDTGQLQYERCLVLGEDDHGLPRWFLYQRNALAESLVEADGPLGTVGEFIRPLGAKVPAHLLRKAIAFFRAIYQAHKAEAFLRWDYNTTTGVWMAVCPPQVVTGGGVKFTAAPDPLPGFCSAADCHSHAGFGSFYSGTDDKDDATFDGYHIVVGHLDRADVDIQCSLSIRGRRVKMDAADLFEDYEDFTFPAEWLAMVSEPVAVVATPAIGYQGPAGGYDWRQENWREQDKHGKKGHKRHR